MPKYKPKQSEVEAIQIKKQMGEFLPGDYFVTTEDDQFLMTREEFESKYEKVEESVPAPILNHPPGVRTIATEVKPSYASTAHQALMALDID